MYRSPYVDDNKNLVTGAKVSNGKVEILSATSSLRIRPWDLKSECFHMWFPFTKSFKTLGSDNVVAVYAKNCDLLYVDSINRFVQLYFLLIQRKNILLKKYKNNIERFTVVR